VTLAFLTALQLLPPRQRAVLVLCDVLDWRAREVAQLLEITVSAVNSALHRARATLSKHYVADPTENSIIPTGNLITLERYVRAWEASDVAELITLLKEDATYTMPPSITWFQGKAVIGKFFAARVFVDGAVYRLQPIHASSRPAYANYLYDQRTDKFRAHSIHVLSLADSKIVGLTIFLKATLFSYFDLPVDI